MPNNLITLNAPNVQKIDNSYFQSVLKYIRENEVPDLNSYRSIHQERIETRTKETLGLLLSKKFIELIVTLTQSEGDELDTFLQTLLHETLTEYLYNKDACVVIQWEEISMLMCAFHIRSKVNLSSMVIEGIGQIESFFISNDTLSISTIREDEKGIHLESVDVFSI